MYCLTVYAMLGDHKMKINLVPVFEGGPLKHRTAVVHVGHI